MHDGMRRAMYCRGIKDKYNSRRCEPAASRNIQMSHTCSVVAAVAASPLHNR